MKSSLYRPITIYQNRFQVRFNFIKSNLIYAVGSVANSAALLLLIPFLIRMLSEEAYGTWSMLELTITLLVTGTSAGLGVGFMRHYWFVSNQGERIELFSTVLWTSVAWSIGLSLLFSVALSSGVNPGLQVSFGQLAILLTIGGLETIFNLFLTLFRIQERATIFVVLSIARMLLFLGTAIWLTYYGWGVDGVLMARCASVGIMLISAVALGFEYVGIYFNVTQLRAVVTYGAPLLGADLANFILFASDRYVLQAYAGLETIAVYTFAYKLATIADILVNRPFAIDWASRRFKIAAQADSAPTKYSQVLTLYLAVVSIVTLVIIAVTPAFYSWFAPSTYATGLPLVPILLVGYIIFGLSYPLNIGIMLKNKTHYLIFTGWGAAILCLGLNFWLIPRYGMWGASWATVIAYSTMTFTIAYLSLRLYPIPYRIDHISWIVAIWLVGFVGIKYLDWVWPDTNAYLQVIVPLAWICLLYFVSIVSFNGKKLFQLASIR